MQDIALLREQSQCSQQVDQGVRLLSAADNPTEARIADEHNSCRSSHILPPEKDSQPSTQMVEKPQQPKEPGHPSYLLFEKNMVATRSERNKAKGLSEFALGHAGIREVDMDWKNDPRQFLNVHSSTHRSGRPVTVKIGAANGHRPSAVDECVKPPPVIKTENLQHRRKGIARRLASANSPQTLKTDTDRKSVKHSRPKKDGKKIVLQGGTRLRSQGLSSRGQYGLAGKEVTIHWRAVRFSCRVHRFTAPKILHLGALFLFYR